MPQELTTYETGHVSCCLPLTEVGKPRSDEQVRTLILLKYLKYATYELGSILQFFHVVSVYKFFNL